MNPVKYAKQVLRELETRDRAQILVVIEEELMLESWDLDRWGAIVDTALKETETNS